MKKLSLLIPIAIALGACTTVVEKPAPTTTSTTRETTAVSRPVTATQTTTTHTSGSY